MWVPKLGICRKAVNAAEGARGWYLRTS